MRTSKDTDRPTVEPRDRAQWRRWLELNHATARGVWLAFHKKASTRRGISYDAAVEEALCFGWIDSRTNPLDERRYLQLFTPRNPKSVWSRSNKDRVERLIGEGRMTPAGMAVIQAAKASGTWTAYDAVERGVVPPDLAKALEANSDAKRYFDAFSASAKKGILWWIESAKRPETRARRIEDTVWFAARNMKAPEHAARKSPTAAGSRDDRSPSGGGKA